MQRRVMQRRDFLGSAGIATASGALTLSVRPSTVRADDKVKIGDKGEFAATRTESYEDGKLIAKTWTCKDVPLGGLVRGEGPDGKAYQQLVNFGRGK